MTRRKWTNEDLAKIELLVKSKAFTYSEIANQLNSTPQQIMSVCSYRGWTGYAIKSISSGEEQLVLLLKEIFQNVEIISQFLLPNKQRLDFFIPSLNIGIEYDGIQHFKHSQFFNKTEDSFNSAKTKDTNKENICTKLGIHLIRISYAEKLNKNTILDYYAQIKNGPSSIELEQLKQDKGFISKSVLQRNTIIEKDRKKRQEHLKSEKHQLFLEKAKQSRKERYNYLKTLKKKKG